ncbi:MAG: Type 1 glutamine amidotransferase-like domain-containing protein, partial [Parcubacteria group bacterium]
MSLAEKDIKEFKKLYKERYGEEINDFVAYEDANHLLQMIKAVYKPISKVDEELYSKLEKEHEAVPEDKKVDFIKHLIEDAEVTEFKEKIGEKKFWELVIKARTMGKNMPIKKLLLSSNGSFVIEKGLKLLFDDISKIRLAYITTAGKGSSDKTYIETHKEMLKKEGCNFEEMDIEGKTEDELRELLKNKSAVYVEGG